MQWLSLTLMRCSSLLDAYCAGVWFRDSDKYPASSFSVVSLAICGLILSKLTGTFSTPRWEHGLRETYLSEIKKKNPLYKSPILNERSQFCHDSVPLSLIIWNQEGGSIF